MQVPGFGLLMRDACQFSDPAAGSLHSPDAMVCKNALVLSLPDAPRLAVACFRSIVYLLPRAFHQCSGVEFTFLRNG